MKILFLYFGAILIIGMAVIRLVLDILAFKYSENKLVSILMGISYIITMVWVIFVLK